MIAGASRRDVAAVTAGRASFLQAAVDDVDVASSDRLPGWALSGGGSPDERW